MDALHFHLLVNHLPILGSFFGLALLAAGAVSHDGRRWFTRAALAFFVLVGIGAMAANLSGEGAEERVENFPGVTHRVIHEHEEAAEAALVAAGVLAAVALLGLLLERREHKSTRIVLLAVWLLALVTAGLMARTGYEGGKIRRPELRGEPSQGIEK